MSSHKAVAVVLLSNFCEFLGSQSTDFSDPPELQMLINSLSFSESLEFKALGSTIGKAKPKNCQKGFPCGSSCQPKNRKCRNPLGGQAKDYQSWLEQSAPKSETKPKAGKKPAAKPKNAKSDAKTKAAASTADYKIKDQEDFEKVADYVFNKLNAEGNYGGLVPIYRIRQEMQALSGDPKAFSDSMFEAQARDKFQYAEGSVEDSAPEKIEGCLKSPTTGDLRCYAKKIDGSSERFKPDPEIEKRLEQGKKEKESRSSEEKLGRAERFRKGKPIKDQATFDKEVAEAAKMLDEDFNMFNLIPIAKLKDAFGDRISNDQFDEMLFEMQYNDKNQLIEESVEDNDPKKLEKCAKSPMGARKCYMRLL